jgi:hypothetical protein
VERLAMPDENSIDTNRPIINFDSPKAPPTILTLGVLLWRAIAWWADIDFILSIREEKIAMTLQLLLDYGWLVLAIAGVIWALGAHKAPEDKTNVHWGMVTSVGILAFMAGALITVHAIGSTPMVLTGWGGDPSAKNCSAIIDTSRLVGRKDNDRLVLTCGVADPTHDPMEDEKIAVSQPFTITGQATAIVAPYGAMAAAVSQMPQIPGQAFMLWHAVAIVPKAVDVSEIKRASEVTKRGGKIVTEPEAGAFGSVQAIIPTTPAPSTESSTQKKL